MRHVLIVLLLLLAPGPGTGQPAPGAPATPPGDPFRVLNRTGVEAVALHAVRSGRDDWGRNLLAGPLPPDGGFSLRPAGDAGCRFHLRLVLRDGREAVLRDHDVCTNRVVALTPGAVVAAGAGAAAQPAPPPAPGARLASGTGFLVAPERVLTNQHVIEGCNRIAIRMPDGRDLAAVPPARADAGLDLAVLNVPGALGPALRFREGPAVRRGEGVVVYGFPLAGLLSSDPKLTRGEVNGLAGIGNNPTQFQISAEVQPGNSGGPMLDMQGHVVGVVVSKLNAQRVAQRTGGDIPQNVNFAVKGTSAIEFLRRAGVPPTLATSSGPDRSAADVGDIAHRSTVFIRCERAR